MTDDDLTERNRTKLQEAHPAFRRALAAVLADLKSDGYRPRIQVCWRSPEDQAAAKASGHSKLSWGYHNATAATGEPEALAADVLDDDRPLDPSRDFIFELARAARRQRLATGIDWGVPTQIRRALNLYIENSVEPGRDWTDADGTPGKIGWDALHVEITGLSLAKARAGVRPVNV